MNGLTTYTRIIRRSRDSRRMSAAVLLSYLWLTLFAGLHWHALDLTRQHSAVGMPGQHGEAHGHHAADCPLHFMLSQPQCAGACAASSESGDYTEAFTPAIDAGRLQTCSVHPVSPRAPPTV